VKVTRPMSTSLAKNLFCLFAQALYSVKTGLVGRKFHAHFSSQSPDNLTFFPNNFVAEKNKIKLIGKSGATHKEPGATL